MQRLTSRNPDNSISVDRVSGQELLNRLADYEDQLERIEKALNYLVKCREIALTRSKNTYSNTETYFSAQYAAYHKAIEVIKRAMEGKSYGK